MWTSASQTRAAPGAASVAGQRPEHEQANEEEHAMTTSSNGRTERKSLAGQLDRLDLILDGLADGLNEAVATAVKQAVVVAVEAAVRELLASAELHRRLHPGPAAKTGWARRAASALCHGLVSLAKSCWSCAVTLIGHGRVKATEAVSALQERRAAIVERVRSGMTAFARQVWLGWFIAAGLVLRFRKPLIVAAAVGTGLAVTCYVAGPAVSSAVNGLAGFTGALAAAMLGRLRRVLDRAALLEGYAGRLR
jgi:hypothetical protein